MTFADNPAEIYTNGHGRPAVAFMQKRTLASHGRFIESFLKPGQRILDLGCGPGSITAGIAEQVRPLGEVVGIDQNEEQFDRTLPVTFQAMSAYALDFPDAYFDGVFSHALFEHLSRPLEALLETRRVLKPGGFVGLRSPDWGGFVIHPSSPELETALAARLALQTRNGGHVHAGRHLGAWLREAGFASINVTASYEIYPDNQSIAEHIASQLEKDGQSAHAQVWREWQKNPDALFAQAWFEATASKRRIL